jgi:hypothetical protein
MCFLFASTVVYRSIQKSDAGPVKYVALHASAVLPLNRINDDTTLPEERSLLRLAFLPVDLT